jgi:hypothetical protein
MKKNVLGVVNGHVPARTPRRIKYVLVKLGPRTRLRFPHPKGGVTIISNEGPGFIKVDDAVVFDGEFVRVHDSTRLSIITSYQMPALLSIRDDAAQRCDSSAAKECVVEGSAGTI